MIFEESMTLEARNNVGISISWGHEGAEALSCQMLTALKSFLSSKIAELNANETKFGLVLCVPEFYLADFSINTYIE